MAYLLFGPPAAAAWAVWFYLRGIHWSLDYGLFAFAVLATAWMFFIAAIDRGSR